MGIDHRCDPCGPEDENIELSGEHEHAPLPPGYAVEKGVAYAFPTRLKWMPVVFSNHFRLAVSRGEWFETEEGKQIPMFEFYGIPNNRLVYRATPTHVRDFYGGPSGEEIVAGLVELTDAQWGEVLSLLDESWKGLYWRTLKQDLEYKIEGEWELTRGRIPNA